MVEEELDGMGFTEEDEAGRLDDEEVAAKVYVIDTVRRLITTQSLMNCICLY